MSSVRVRASAHRCLVSSNGRAAPGRRGRMERVRIPPRQPSPTSPTAEAPHSGCGGSRFESGVGYVAGLSRPGHRRRALARASTAETNEEPGHARAHAARRDLDWPKAGWIRRPRKGRRRFKSGRPLGDEAHQVERPARTREVARSNRVVSTMPCRSSLEWTPPCQGGERRFKSGTGRASKWSRGRVWLMALPC